MDTLGRNLHTMYTLFVECLGLSKIGYCCSCWGRVHYCNVHHAVFMRLHPYTLRVYCINCFRELQIPNGKY